MIWHFTIRLKGVDVMTDELIDALFVAGCTDGTPASSEGSAWIGFDREANALDAAIRSAVADVRRAGCAIERIEIEHEELSQWQTV